MQLNIDTALEAGLDEELVKNIVYHPEKLSEELDNLLLFQVIATGADDFNNWQDVESKVFNGSTTRSHIKISCRRFTPTIKRALGHFKSGLCRLQLRNY